MSLGFGCTCETPSPVGGSAPPTAYTHRCKTCSGLYYPNGEDDSPMSISADGPNAAAGQALLGGTIGVNFSPCPKCNGVGFVPISPAADRPVENSETWGRAFSDEELSSMQEQGNWNHFEASLFKTCQRLLSRADRITPEEARLALQCIPWQAPGDKYPGEGALLDKLTRISEVG